MSTYNELFNKCKEIGLDINPARAYSKANLEELIKAHSVEAKPTKTNNDWEVISIYTMEQAIDDGILVRVGTINKTPVVFTSNLFHDGYEDTPARIKLVKKGLELLKVTDKEDDGYRKLRVIEKNKIWVIEDIGSQITFLRPEDY